MKTKSIILIAISLGFGLVAAIGMTQVMGRQSAQEDPNAEQEIDVLVAKHDIEMRQLLTAEDVVSKRYRPSQVPEGVAMSIEEITDMRATGRVGKDNFIHIDHLINKNDEVSIEIPEGYSVYSVTPSIESTFQNSLRPGDRIDIIGIVRNPKGGEQVARTFLKNIHVFGINNKLRRTVSEEEEQVTIKLVQVLLRPRQAEQLALVQSVGKIQFVMRPESAAVVEDEDWKEEEDSGPANLDEFFRDNSKVDHTASQMAGVQQMMHDQAQQMQQMEFSHVEQKEKPFRTVIMTPDGPQEYVYATRNSSPTMVTGAASQGTAAPAAAAPPTTYPPAGLPSPQASSANPAGQGAASGIVESSTNTEEPESE